MEELKNIIEGLKKVSKETKIIPDANMLFDCAVRIRNTRGINQKEAPKIDEPATQEQIDLANKIKISLPAGTTKKEASKIISEKLESNKKEKLKKQEEY